MSTHVGVADTEEQAALVEAVERALERHWGAEHRHKQVGDPAAVSERPVWTELAQLGVAGLPVPEEAGGSGGRWAELAVALEVVGGAVAPVPAIGVAGALGALEVADTPAAARLRAALAEGSSIAAVAWTEAGTGEEAFTATGPAEARVSGRADLLLSPEADALLLLATGPDGPVLVQVDPAAAERRAGLDPTRPTGTLALTHAPATVLARGEVAVAAAGRGRAAAATALAAELVGLVGHCLEGAVDYAATREQFSRPIGSFQAVKHRCADILASLELSRAAARHAAALLDEGTAVDPGALEEAVALALLRTRSAAHEASHGYIQVLGGIGFTWEHEAHLYLRRSGASAPLFGGPQAQLARLDPAAARAAVAPAHTGPAAELDSAVRELLPAHRATWGVDDSFTARLDWQRTLHGAGWIAPQWPTGFGGRGVGIVDQVACDGVLAAHRAPALAGVLGVNNVAPTLMHYGTPEQQAHLAAIQAGTEVWCQGFSEPGSGSDLASLRTRAVVEENGDFVVSGQKVWTSEGMEADHCLLLVRTDPEAPPHRGISALLMPLDLPGITRRPITQITGEGGFAELFFDDVRVPRSALLGPLHKGWTVTMTTLAFERSGVIMMAGRLEQDVLGVVETLEGRDLDPATRTDLAERLAECRLVGLLGRRALGRIAAGGTPGPEHSVIKLAWSLASQHVAETHLAALGADAVADPSAAAARHAYLLSRASTIAGGTTEIMRNILAERVLGMPR